MIQILPTPQGKPNFAQQFNEAFQQGIQAYQSQEKQKKLQEAYKKMGFEPGTELLPENVQKVIAERKFPEPEKPLDEQKRLLLEKLFSGGQQPSAKGSSLIGGESISPEKATALGIEQASQRTPAMKKQTQFGGFSPEQKLALSIADPQAFRALQSEEEESQRQFEHQEKTGMDVAKMQQAERHRQEDILREDAKHERKIADERTKGISERADLLRDTMPMTEAAWEAQRAAVETGNLGPGTLNAWGEAFGLPWMKDAAAGQFKTGGKSFLINNVVKFGSRPNQYIEQQIENMLAKIGVSDYANFGSLALAKFDLDVNRAYLDAYDKVYDEYDGNLPKNAGKLINDEMKKYVDYRQNDLANELKMYVESDGKAPAEMVFMYKPDGTRLEVPFKKINDALSKGAKYQP